METFQYLEGSVLPKKRRAVRMKKVDRERRRPVIVVLKQQDFDLALRPSKRKESILNTSGKVTSGVASKAAPWDWNDSSKNE